jgi:hypothetical protein
MAAFGSSIQRDRLDRLSRGLPTLVGVDQFSFLRLMGLKNATHSVEQMLNNQGKLCHSV